jgi:serine acetyltransferase
VTKDVPANAVVAGSPARIIRMREAPKQMRWPNPVEPDPEAHTTLRPPA